MAAKKRRKRILSEEGVKKAIIRLKGNYEKIAKSFHVTRSAVRQYIADRPELAQYADDQREGRVDRAESGLDKAIDAGEAWAIAMTLKTVGKKRGYTEKQEIEMSGTVSAEDISRMSHEELRAYYARILAVRGVNRKGIADKGTGESGSGDDPPRTDGPATAVPRDPGTDAES